MFLKLSDTVTSSGIAGPADHVGQPRMKGNGQPMMLGLLGTHEFDAP